MERQKAATVVASRRDSVAGAADRIAHDVVRSVPIENKCVNRLLAVGRQEDLHVELDRKVLDESRELHEEFGVNRVLEFVDEQYASADSGVEQSNLEHTTHAFPERREVGRFVEVIVNDQKPVVPVGQLDVAEAGVDAFPDEVDDLLLRSRL